MDFSSHDGALHRVPRLQKALRIATAIMGITPHHADLLIHELRDNRGTLEVSWISAPSAHQRAAWATAWEQCGERAEDVRHSFEG